MIHLLFTPSSIGRLRKHRSLGTLVGVLCTGLLIGCVTPTSDIRRFAEKAGYREASVEAEGYDHLVYTSGFGDQTDTLHVYLEGDGQPWRHRTIIMPDPTPRRPMMLRLMRQDRAPSAYLGRPCYNGTSDDDGCGSDLWTSARYGPTVVGSMTSALRKLIERYQVKDVWLLGHSGGGTLAMLLAARFPEVTRVVTIAGNLDVQAWVRHHGYTPLYSSLDPAQEPDLPASVVQWHLLGSRDQVIPPPLVRPFVLRQPGAVGLEFPNFTHGCCWSTLWPTLLDSLANDEPDGLPAQRFH